MTIPGPAAAINGAHEKQEYELMDLDLTPEQEMLGEMVRGVCSAFASLEPRIGFSATAVQARATADGDEFVIDGVKWHVPFASSAAALVVLARMGEGERDVDLFLVDPAAPGVSRQQQMTIASDAQYEV